MRIASLATLRFMLAFAALASVAAFASADGGAPIVDATVVPSVATVGDRLTLRLRVERQSGTDVEYPDVPAAVAPLAVLSSATTEEREEQGRLVQEYYYIVAAFETGALGVPQLPFQYSTASGESGIVWSDSLTITIESVMPDTLSEGPADPRDIKPPVDLPRRVWPFVVAAAVAAAAFAGLYYLRRWWLSRKRGPKEEPPAEPVVPKRAAHLVALERLAALQADDPAGRGDVIGFYVRVTEIVRFYVRDRFAVDAIDMTTAELAPAMDLARIGREEIEWTVNFLSRADLAKFARHAPGVDEAASDLMGAREFVERTRFMGDEEDETGEGEPGTDDGAGDGESSRGDANGPLRDDADGKGDEL